MSCIGMQAVLDSYVCLFHLVIGIFIGVFLLCFSLIRVILTNRHSPAILHFFYSIDDTWNVFLLVAFLYFVSFSVFEMRYLMIIWKARRPSEPNQDWEDMRRQISSMYTKICTQFHLFSSYHNIFLIFFPPQTSLLLLDFQSFTFWLTIYFTFCCLCIPTGFLKYIATPQEILVIPSTGNIYSEFL